MIRQAMTETELQAEADRLERAWEEFERNPVWRLMERYVGVLQEESRCTGVRRVSAEDALRNQGAFEVLCRVPGMPRLLYEQEVARLQKAIQKAQAEKAVAAREEERDGGEDESAAAKGKTRAHRFGGTGRRRSGRGY